MKRIYIAGKYNDKDIVSCLANIRRGIEMGAYLVKEGFAVYCPFLDFQFGLSMFGYAIEKKDYQDNSMAWVEVSDALFILPGWETSGGTKREIARAESLCIPVFYDLEGLREWSTRNL